MPDIPDIQTPLIVSADLPALGGRVGPDLSDFVVEERPLYEPSGDGAHLYWFVEKRGMTTPDMVRVLARLTGTRERDIGYAGMKDKHAVTRQWVSLPESASRALDASANAEPGQTALPEPLRLVATTRHTNKLRTGHLVGNRFSIRLVDLDAGPEEAQSRAEAILGYLNQTGLPNYFGRQRYGYGGSNLEKAIESLAPPVERAAPATTEPGGTPRRRGRRLTAFEQKLFPSVLQSEVFNRYLTLRLGQGLGQLLDGEVVRLKGKSAVFSVESASLEQPRLVAGELVPTGPMPGKKMKAAQGPALDLETQAVEQLNLSWEFFAGLGRHAPGTRRDLLVWPEEPRVSPAAGGLRVEFSLPAGSYATQLIRELTRQPFLDAPLTRAP